ncbi:Cro/CI family transcriptional regulator [Proteus sp. fly-1067]|uniref:Cro/CI family transcriptional regulator n=1 Tax=Proteus sp. fly-1067 TaxID=3136674 RepID=UPI0032DABEDC
MQKELLSEFVRKNGQGRTAELLGVHQTAISQALRKGRIIYISTNGLGGYEAEEIKPFPNKIKEQLGAPSQHADA